MVSKSNKDVAGSSLVFPGKAADLEAIANLLTARQKHLEKTREARAEMVAHITPEVADAYAKAHPTPIRPSEDEMDFAHSFYRNERVKLQPRVSELEA